MPLPPNSVGTRRRTRLDDLDPFNQVLAILETVAHLEVLIERGHVSGADVDGIRHYRVGRASSEGEGAVPAGAARHTSGQASLAVWSVHPEVSGASGGLLEPDHVAGRVAEGAVPHTIELIGRFLRTSAPLVATRSKSPSTSSVPKISAPSMPFGEQVGHGVLVGIAHAGIDTVFWRTISVLRLGRGLERAPAEAAVADVGGDGAAEDVAVERERLLVVVGEDEDVGDGQVSSAVVVVFMEGRYGPDRARFFETDRFAMPRAPRGFARRMPVRARPEACKGNDGDPVRPPMSRRAGRENRRVRR